MSKLFLTLALLPLGAFAGGRHLPEQINAIYSYQCEATFFEGEGVRPDMLSCVPYQRLGLITAKYTHYLYANDDGNNFGMRMQTENYPYSLCGRQFTRTSCESSSEAAFGLSQYAEGEFQTPISLTASRVSGLMPYGYAAVPDADGECAPGLEKRWAYKASPQSVTNPLPSSFWNDGQLDNWEVRARNGHSPAFDIFREASTSPCDAGGNCWYATFGGRQLIQSTPYTKVSQPICVIPADETRALVAKPKT